MRSFTFLRLAALATPHCPDFGHKERSKPQHTVVTGRPRVTRFRVITGLKRFWRCESGAVTVEWVVLAAIVIGLGMVVLIPVAFSTESSTQKIADDISSRAVGYGNN
jgi:Flp pilus assembly protein TadG